MIWEEGGKIIIDRRGLEERLNQLGIAWHQYNIKHFPSGPWRSIRGKEHMYIGGYDQIKDRVHLLQDTGKMGGVSSRFVPLKTFIKNYRLIA